MCPHLCYIDWLVSTNIFSNSLYDTSILHNTPYWISLPKYPSIPIWKISLLLMLPLPMTILPPVLNPQPNCPTKPHGVKRSRWATFGLLRSATNNIKFGFLFAIVPDTNLRKQWNQPIPVSPQPRPGPCYKVYMFYILWHHHIPVCIRKNFSTG
jgi:hypothetical protein